MVLALLDREPEKVYLSIRSKGIRLTRGTIGPFDDAVKARAYYNAHVNAANVLRATIQNAEGKDLFVLTQQ